MPNPKPQTRENGRRPQPKIETMRPADAFNMITPNTQIEIIISLGAGFTTRRTYADRVAAADDAENDLLRVDYIGPSDKGGVSLYCRY